MDWTAHDISRQCSAAAELATAQSIGRLDDGARLNRALAQLRGMIDGYLGDDRWARLMVAYEKVKLFPETDPFERAHWLEFRQAVEKVVEGIPEARINPPTEDKDEPMLPDKLRAADEDAVEAALRGSFVERELAGVDRTALLEFHNRMLDLEMGEVGD